MFHLFAQFTKACFSQRRLTIILVAMAALLSAGIPAALADLGRAGPVVAANGYPAWYQDKTGISLELGAALNQPELDGGWNVTLPVDVPTGLAPEVFPSKWAVEHFYWSAGCVLTDTTSPAGAVKLTLVLGLEAGFGGGVVLPGDQVVFGRLRVKVTPLPYNGDYRIYTPYGVWNFPGMVAGDRIFLTDDIGIGSPGQFDIALSSHVGPFLLPSLTPGGAEIAPITGPVPGKLYIADPARLGPVTGSILPAFRGSDNVLRNHNIFRVEGPNGWVVQTTDFSLTGRVFNGVIPGQVTIDRASYARTASRLKIDVYAKGLPSTQGRIPGGTIQPLISPILSFYNAPPTVDPVTGALSAPAGQTAVPMFSTGTTYWGQSSPLTLPTAITVRDSNARNGAGAVVSAFYQAPVTDQIFVDRAYYDPLLGRLGVRARSSDQLTTPLLTLGGFGNLLNGEFSINLLSAPPSKASILSSAGGLNEAQVSTTLVPEAPTGVTAVAGNARATISFAPPAVDGGSPITLYTVTSSPGGITTTGTASPITVTGLVNGTAYTFTVTATNAMGIGPASLPSNSVTPATIPGAPTIGLTTAGNTTASVTFLAPVSNGGSPVVLYTVTSSPGGLTASNSTGTPIVVTGLTNGTAYTFTVTATNAVGTSLPSASSNSVVPATVPGAPTIGVASPGLTQAAVSFTPPASNGGQPILSYTVTASPGGLTATGPASPLFVNSLTNGTTYTFTVTATNLIGTGPASTASNGVVPGPVPDPPTSVVAVGGNTTASITFTPIVPNPSTAIILYTATSNPGNIQGAAPAPPILVAGLTNGTPYTFTVTSADGPRVGLPSVPSNSVTPSTLPGAPTAVVATGGNTTADVAFVPPASAGGSPITLYTVTASPGGRTGSGSASPIPVTGLTNGTAYTFTVVAISGAGTGPASAPSNSVTPGGAPGAPTAVSATAGNASANVTFVAPASNGGGPITLYTVTATPGGRTGTGSVSPVAVTGLTNGTIYTFTVTATNSFGTGPASVSSNATLPATVPSAPTLPSAVAGNASANVSFVAPPNGGLPISLYTATSTPGGITGTGAASPVAVSGLTNGTNYTFTVAATNPLGTGPASAASNSVRPVAVPGEPTAVVATGGNRLASIAFTPPVSSGGSAITSYRATATPGGGTGTASVSPVVVTGLTNGTAYTFTVVAINAIGNSVPSVPSNSVTPSTLPSEPLAVSAIGGNTTASIAFTPPVSSGGSAITSYRATATPGGRTASATASPISVIGLTNGTAYTFAVEAINGSGAGPASLPSNSVTPSAVPGVPTAVSATGGSTSASVAFTPPASTGGSPITLYTVTATPGGATGTGTASPVNVPGLTNGTAYTFTVTASNASGTGPASLPSNSVTPSAGPGAPTAVSATGGNTTANVAFTPPASTGGSPITLYTATSTPGGLVGTATASPVNVPGLTNGTAYTFTVTAANASGTGPASLPSNSVTPAAVPGVPTAVSATAGNTTANIAFTAPASTGGSPITLYTVTATPGGRTGTGTASPVAVTGLTNGTAYTFTVTAANASGTGLASLPSNSVTPATLPGVPTAASALAGNGTANVAFTAPLSDGGSPITLYTATSTPGGRVGSATASPVAVPGLTNGTAYTFTVRATNAIGIGAPSAQTNSVIPRAVPGSPTAVAAVAGNAAATVSFTPPVANGGSAITLYTATSTPGGRVGTANASPVVVTGLTNGTAYTFTVSATNAAGAGLPSTASNPVTPATVPQVPTAISATAGNASASIRFTPPASNGGSPITLYTVTASPGGAVGTGTASPVSVIGLTNGTAYTFTVRATNAVGSSAASAVSNSVTPAGLPGSATNVLATAGNATANVSFFSAASNGSPITLYTVTSSPGGVTASRTGSPITVTGLTNNITYTFTVRATNAIGVGPASVPSSSVTPTSTRPTAPSGTAAAPSALSVNPPTVRITWLDNSNNEAAFQIQRATNSTFTTGLTQFAVTSNVTAYTDTTPLQQTTYFYRVMASNAVGTSAVSNAASATTPGRLPAAPTNLNQVSATINSITLGVTDNANNEQGFNLERSTVGPTGPWVLRATFPVNANPVPAVGTGADTGLTRNTPYWYRIQAFNADGVSTFSNVLSGRTLP